MARFGVTDTALLDEPGSFAGELMGEAKRGMRDVSAATTYGTVLRGLRDLREGSSGGSSLDKNLGGLLEGVGSLFEGVSKSQAGLFELLLSQAKPAQSGGSDGQMMMMLVALMMHQGEMQAKNLQEQLATERRHADERYQDLQQRSGPGPFDSVMYPVMQGLAQSMALNMAKPPADPIDQLASLAERIGKVRGAVPALFGGDGAELSENGLRLKVMEYEAAAKADGQRTERLKVQAGRDRWRSAKGLAHAFAQEMRAFIGMPEGEVIDTTAEEAADELLSRHGVPTA